MSNTKLIDCSNIKSLNYTRTSERSKNNAQWENIVDIQLNVGDQINIENAILNIKGISSDATVEILGEDDKDSKLADSKVGIRCIPYICDTGENAVALPHCGFSKEPLFYDVVDGTAGDEQFKPKLIEGAVCYDTYDLDEQPPFTEFYPQLNFYDNQRMIFMSAQYTSAGDQVFPNLNTIPYNYGAPSTNEKDFCFSYHRTGDTETNQMRTPLKYELYTNFTEFPKIGNFNYNSGLKYTIIDSNYKGPFRSNQTDFESGEDDFIPEYLDIKLDLGGAVYESPSTVCNILNDQLNNSNAYFSNPKNLVNAITNNFTVNKLPQITGSLSKTKMVNGRRKLDDGSDTVGKTNDTSPLKCWGNIAVRNYNEWLMVHKLMRMKLTEVDIDGGANVEGVFFHSTANVPGRVYRSFRPIYHIPGSYMRVNDLPSDDNLNNYVARQFYPRIGVKLTMSNFLSTDKYVDFEQDNEQEYDIYQKIYYTCLPQYFVMTFNIAYNEDNIKRFGEAFRRNEIYDGSFIKEDDYNNDIENWRIHFDNGESQMGDANDFNDDDGRSHYGYGQGVFNYTNYDQTNTYNNTYQGYAYSQAALPFGMDNLCPGHDNAFSTPKSDVPDVGASRFTKSGLHNSLEIQTGTVKIKDETLSPHFFKNNKNGDGRPAFFSRYNKDWKTLFKTSNVPDNIKFSQDNNNSQIAGLGFIPPDFIRASTDDTDDLSKKYNVGVYPFYVQMKNGTFHNMCGLLLYRDSATFDPLSKEFNISEDFAIPCITHGQFAVSTSFYDHPAVWLVNGRKYNETTKIETSILKTPKSNGMLEEENINEINIGCDNPTIQFDNNLSKVTFSNLHNVKKLGLFDMAGGADNSSTGLTYTLTNMGDPTIKVNNTNVKYPLIWDLFTHVKNYTVQAGTNVQSPVDVDQVTTPCDGRSWNLIHSTSGIFFEKFFGESILENNSDLDNMTVYNEDNFEGSLLNKLGFKFTDLVPPFGNQTNLYDYSKVHSNDPQELQLLCKPITTNPLIDISDIPDLAVSDFTASQSYDKSVAGDTQYGGLPVYDLSLGTIAQINLDASNSELIIASNLPTKLTSPYFLVYSNIGNGDYVQNKDQLQVVGIILKNYISGDFIYSFASQGFTVLSPLKLTSIKIVIRDNSGRIVSLNENNSIIFKITRNAIESILDKPNPENVPEKNNKK